MCLCTNFVYVDCLIHIHGTPTYVHNYFMYYRTNHPQLKHHMCVSCMCMLAVNAHACVEQRLYIRV